MTILCGLFAITGIAPAAAHDTLVSVDPEDQSVLEAAPERVTFTFSGELIDVSPQTILTSGEGTIDIDPPVIDGYDLISELPPLEPGDYQIAYSVVSSDGHRIEGATTFIIRGGEDSEADDSGIASTPPVQDKEEASEPEEPASRDVTIIRWAGIIIMVLGIAVIVTRRLKSK